MPFQRALAPSETQITSNKIWTLVTDSISKDDDRYAKRASLITWTHITVCKQIIIIK